MHIQSTIDLLKSIIKDIQKSLSEHDILDKEFYHKRMAIADITEAIDYLGALIKYGQKNSKCNK